MNANTEEKPFQPPETVALPSEHAPTPGALVRAARDRAHLSLDELAAQTKLARHTLEALERDDYKALLEPVYVRGYYRKCAKVLDIPERELIDAYQARVEPRTPAAPSKLRLASGTDLGSTSRLPIALAIFFALVAVVICGFLWFWRAKLETVPPSIAERAGTVVSEPAPAPAAAPPVAETAPEVPADEFGTGEATLPTGSGIPPPAATSQLTQQPPSATPTVPPPATPATPAVTAGGNGTVSFNVTLTSWVRVDDASGKTLFNSLVKPGDVQTISGTPPLSVFLGNAPGVAVEFNGQPVDTRKATRGNNTAKFVLPPPQ